MGILFLLKRDGRIWIGTQSATTYQEAPFWAGQSAQACVPAAAFLLLKLTLVCALIAPLHGRAKKDAVMTACPAVEIALLCALAGTFFSASRPSGC